MPPKEEGSEGSGEAGEEGIAGRPLDLNQAPSVENGGEKVVSGNASTAQKDLTRWIYRNTEKSLLSAEIYEGGKTESC